MLEKTILYDHSVTWQCGEFVAHHNERVINPSETLPVELSDGRVLFNIRSEAKEKRRLFSISADGATGWSAHQFDEELLEPVCMASLLKLQPQTANDQAVILFANPDNLENELTGAGGNLAHDRKRLTVKMSRNDCQSWTVSKVLEEGPSGYSDLAQASDGSILCIYECGMLDHMCDTKNLTVARFDVEWLLEK
jgi:sialidase-1